MGYISIETNVDVDVEISMDDIVNNLHRFNNKDIELLKDSIDYELGLDKSVISADNLLDVQKIEILNELFKLNLNILEEIKNSYIK